MATTRKAVSKPTNKKTVATPVKTQYLGETDPAQYIHSHKTHRTASEAFRDADYATSMWRCETDWDRTKEYLVWVAMWAFFFFMMYQGMVGFEKWIAS